MIDEARLTQFAAGIASGLPIEEAAPRAGITDTEEVFRFLKSATFLAKVQQLQAAAAAWKTMKECPGKVEALAYPGEPWPEGPRCELCGGRHIHVVRPGQAVVYMPVKDPLPGVTERDYGGPAPGIYPDCSGSGNVFVFYEPEPAAAAG